MEHCAIFGTIDLLALEHGIDSLPQAGLLRQLQEELYGVGGDAVLRVIEINSRCFRCQALPALWIACEELAQMRRARFQIMGLKALPSGSFSESLIGKRSFHCCHVSSSFVSLAGLLEVSALYRDHAHQLFPGFDERLGAFILEPRSQSIYVDASFRELRERFFRVIVIR